MLLSDLVSLIYLTLFIDRDTVLSAKTWECSLLSCGAVLEACDNVMKGNVHNAFCAVRPPGHHAGVYGKTL
jgi:acetoin utilization deacetylase AcuC-like enzyme